MFSDLGLDLLGFNDRYKRELEHRDRVEREQAQHLADIERRKSVFYEQGGKSYVLYDGELIEHD